MEYDIYLKGVVKPSFNTVEKSNGKTFTIIRFPVLPLSEVRFK